MRPGTSIEETEDVLPRNLRGVLAERRRVRGGRRRRGLAVGYRQTEVRHHGSNGGSRSIPWASS